MQTGTISREIGYFMERVIEKMNLRSITICPKPAHAPAAMTHAPKKDRRPHGAKTECLALPGSGYRKQVFGLRTALWIFSLGFLLCGFSPASGDDLQKKTAPSETRFRQKVIRTFDEALPKEFKGLPKKTGTGLEPPDDLPDEDETTPVFVPFHASWQTDTEEVFVSMQANLFQVSESGREASAEPVAGIDRVYRISRNTAKKGDAEKNGIAFILMGGRWNRSAAQDDFLMEAEVPAAGSRTRVYTVCVMIDAPEEGETLIKNAIRWDLLKKLIGTGI